MSDACSVAACARMGWKPAFESTGIALTWYHDIKSPGLSPGLPCLVDYIAGGGGGVGAAAGSWRPPWARGYGNRPRLPPDRPHSGPRLLFRTSPRHGSPRTRRLGGLTCATR